MTYIATGIVTKIIPIEKGVSKAGKEWQKLSFVIDTKDEYNPDLCLQVFGQEKCDKFIEAHGVGDEVEVNFNVYSREFKGKYYHNVDAWKVATIHKDALANEPVPTAQEESEDLPF